MYIPGGWAHSRIQLWLLSDYTWGVSTDSQVGTLASTSKFERTVLTSEQQRYLIDARAGRVANWLNRPKGTLNPAIT